jgi:hypothetical protein
LKESDKSSFNMEEVRPEPADEDNLVSLNIKIRPDLYRAYQRCSWIIIHETDRRQLDIMREMVEDFLIKHCC